MTASRVDLVASLTISSAAVSVFVAQATSDVEVAELLPLPALAWALSVVVIGVLVGSLAAGLFR